MNAVVATVEPPPKKRNNGNHKLHWESFEDEEMHYSHWQETLFCRLRQNEKSTRIQKYFCLHLLSQRLHLSHATAAYWCHFAWFPAKEFLQTFQISTFSSPLIAVQSCHEEDVQQSLFQLRQRLNHRQPQESRWSRVSSSDRETFRSEVAPCVK